MTAEIYIRFPFHASVVAIMNDFSQLITTIEQVHGQIQASAANAINQALTIRNWLIGFHIVEFEQAGNNRSTYGDRLMARIADTIAIRGLSAPELSRCRQFYLVYPHILEVLAVEFRSQVPPAILATLPKMPPELLEKNLGTASQELKQNLGTASQTSGEILGTLPQEFKEIFGTVSQESKDNLGTVSQESKDNLGTVSQESKDNLGTVSQESENNLGTVSQESEGNLGTVSQESEKPAKIPFLLTPEAQLELESRKKLQVPAEKIIRRLSFSHLVELIKINDPLKRAFYEIQCIKGTWSVRELKRQIGSAYFERSGLSGNPAQLASMVLKKTQPQAPKDIIKNIYTFDFLDIKGQNLLEESELEAALLDHLQAFIIELGHGFCLEARQKRILIGDNYYFIDLVFYHRILKCHVLVDLKLGPFQHGDIGQLNTYLNYYRLEISEPADNPPIGILMVAEKDTALVHYATAGMDENLFIQQYLIKLPNKDQLEKYLAEELQRLR